MGRQMNFAIVGCGNIGQKRAKSLQSDDKLIFCADTNIGNARKLAHKYGSESLWYYIDALTPDVDAVIISPNNSNLFPVAMCAIENKKHVLIEKPAGINTEEISRMIEFSKKQNVIVMVGYNHRKHSALLKANRIINDGEIGGVNYIVAKYGHGGCANENANSWRLNKSLSGGGELIEKSCHLIDLSRWIFKMKDDELFKKINGIIKNYHRDKLEDNTFLNLETNLGQIAFLHGSCTDWRNTFEFSIYGGMGKIDITGLGGSYGIEKLSFSQIKKNEIKPLVFQQEFLNEDNSWSEELKEFKKCIELNGLPQSNLYSALETMRVVEEIYKMNGVNI